MSPPRGALLVGSVNLPDAETTFRTAAEVLGDRLKRIPDGELGDRVHWISHQPERIARTPGVERVGDEPSLFNGRDIRPLRIAAGVVPDGLTLKPLGYARDALASWETFERLRGAGVIPQGTRFQVCLPTPAAVVGTFVLAEQRATFETVYERALFAELDVILDSIPHHSLAIQWDTALEFGLIEKADYSGIFQSVQPWFDDVWAGILERAVRQAGRVPAGVEVGFHLCYGDAGEKHFVEPTDTANLVKFAKELLASATRPISWIHMPVPIDRDDDAYFEPLDDLVIPDHTEFYLGLVHREDGVSGARRRIETASRHVPGFGVATECGVGRAPAGATGALLATHREVSEAW